MKKRCLGLLGLGPVAVTAFGFLPAPRPLPLRGTCRQALVAFQHPTDRICSRQRVVVQGQRDSRDPFSPNRRAERGVKTMKESLKGIKGFLKQAGPIALAVPLALPALAFGGAFLLGTAASAGLLVMIGAVTTALVASAFILPPLVMGAILPLIGLVVLLSTPFTFTLIALGPILLAGLAWVLGMVFLAAADEDTIFVTMDERDNGVLDVRSVEVTTEEEDEEDKEIKEARRSLQDFDERLRNGRRW